MRNCLRDAVVIMGLATMFAVALPYAAEAETFHCANEDVQCLIFAINDANSDVPEKSTITLEPGGTYTLMSVDNITDGENGLPSITGDLTIRVKGKGTATLTRASDAPNFRLLHVAATGHLRLRDLVVSNGFVGRFGSFVGGVAQPAVPGSGGGLFNSGGEVRLDRVTFADNGAMGDETTFRGAGAIESTGNVTIKKSTFVNNRHGSLHFLGDGPSAIHNTGHLTIIESTFDRNLGDRSTALESIGTMTIFRSRITDTGGGVFVLGGSAWISETTFAGNRAECTAALGVSGTATVFVTESAFVENESAFCFSVVVGGGGRSR